MTLPPLVPPPSAPVITQQNTLRSDALALKQVLAQSLGPALPVRGKSSLPSIVVIPIVFFASVYGLASRDTSHKCWRSSDRSANATRFAHFVKQFVSAVFAGSSGGNHRGQSRRSARPARKRVRRRLGCRRESENGPPDESCRERLRAQVGDDQASDSGSDEVSQVL